MEMLHTTRTIEILREGSDPAQFDIEYDVDYSVFVRDDDDETEVQVEGIESVTYYPDAESEAWKLDFRTLAPELQTKIDAAIKADVANAERSIVAELQRDYFEREQARADDEADRRYDERIDRE